MASEDHADNRGAKRGIDGKEGQQGQSQSSAQAKAAWQGTWFASLEASSADDAVATMLSSYDANTRAVVEAIRRDVAAIKGVETGVKWNSVSFRVGDMWFATVNVRAKEGMVLVLHAGAKGESNIKSQVSEMKGAAGLKWLGVERAVVSMMDVPDWSRKWKTLKGVVVAWAQRVSA